MTTLIGRKYATFVVVGGGIAGVTCVETLSNACPNESIVLVSASPMIKAVTNYHKLSAILESFDVEERPLSSIECCHHNNVQVWQTAVVSLLSDSKVVITSDGRQLHYNKLCLASGGVPKLIPGYHNPCVLGIRDTHSVKDFQELLSQSHRIVVVGNGGIATELVYEVKNCEVIWVIKDTSIAKTFVDGAAAHFFMSRIKLEKSDHDTFLTRTKYAVQETDLKQAWRDEGCLGSALGPDWASIQSMNGNLDDLGRVHVEFSVGVVRVMDPEEFCEFGLNADSPPGFVDIQGHSWGVFVELTNGRLYGCDMVVSATGVKPFIEPFVIGNNFEVADDGGLKVDDKLQTSIPDIYAAGDACTASWDMSELWLQMRLWTQARQMGCYAGRSMVASLKGQDITLDICFELFTHVTTFFGYKVVLLGFFNAQTLGDDYEVLLRITEGREYVKVVLHDGKLVGAILIGETDLEETFENLALNRTDLTAFKEHLLDPAIDIDDFFD